MPERGHPIEQIDDGPTVAAVRARLADRAALLGFPVSGVLEIRLDAAGSISTLVPSDVRTLRLVSSSARVAGDRRLLVAFDWASDYASGRHRGPTPLFEQEKLQIENQRKVALETCSTRFKEIIKAQGYYKNGAWLSECQEQAWATYKDPTPPPLPQSTRASTRAH